jgi:K+-sensing histidine kinase KdpD
LLTPLLTALYHPLITHICFSISIQAKSDPSIGLCFFLILLILIALFGGCYTSCLSSCTHTLTFNFCFILLFSR